jgi:hypothetical protein
MEVELPGVEVTAEAAELPEVAVVAEAEDDN